MLSLAGADIALRVVVAAFRAKSEFQLKRLKADEKWQISRDFALTRRYNGC
jgi:hypothetical protein